MQACTYTKDQIKQSILGKLQRYNGKTLEEATPYQKYFGGGLHGA